MKNRTLLVLLAILAGCNEPSYDGKSLSYWREQMHNSSQSERWRAARVLGIIGPKAEVAVPELTKAIQSDDTVLRFEAARALGSIGPAARPAVPALKELLKDDNRNVRRVAEEALKAIDKEPEAAPSPK